MLKSCGVLLLMISLLLVACSCTHESVRIVSNTTALSSDTFLASTEGNTDTNSFLRLKYTNTALDSKTEGIKILGVRALESDKSINCDWSCSGIEFNINCNGGDIKFSVETRGAAYFRAYSNCDTKSPK